MPKKYQTNLDEVLARHRLTQKNVSDVLGYSGQAVSLWCNGDRLLRAETALQIEKLLSIPRWELRPDLWSPPLAATG